jgi:nucleoside-diphosphate-sugar epimerase
MRDVFAVSGTGGFIGSHLVVQSKSCGLRIISLLRCPSESPDVRRINLNGLPISTSALFGCTVVIHVAARAHVLSEIEVDPLYTFRLSNCFATLRLAEAAVAAGVRRFVFVSSIGVLGNHSRGKPFDPSDPLMPVEDYAISKAEAESALAELATRTGLEVVIVRPPLVHGPGAKGNFHRLLEGIANERSLPLGGVNNRRSFIGVSNLADALITAATAPFSDFISSGEKKATVIYHVADNGIISTRRLVEVLAEGMGVKPRLINLPRWLAVGGATLLGKGAMARRLFDDLEVDASAFTKDTGWQPKKSLEDGLREMAAAYAQQHRVGRFG